MTATDPNAGDSIASYTLSGTDAALFEITTAGALAFSAAPNFEDPAGGVDDDSNSYTVTVTNVKEAPAPPECPSLHGSRLSGAPLELAGR